MVLGQGLADQGGIEIAEDTAVFAACGERETAADRSRCLCCCRHVHPHQSEGAALAAPLPPGRSVSACRLLLTDLVVIDLLEQARDVLDGHATIAASSLVDFV